MPMKCSVCSHPQREQVDAALLGGITIRDIADLFELTKSALGRHRKGCLSTALATVTTQRAESIGDMWSRIKSELDQVAAQAKQAKDNRTLLAALAQLRGMVDTALKAQELRQQSAPAFDPQRFLQLVGDAVERALSDDGDARQRVADELARVEAELPE